MVPSAQEVFEEYAVALTTGCRQSGQWVLEVPGDLVAFDFRSDHFLMNGIFAVGGRPTPAWDAAAERLGAHGLPWSAYTCGVPHPDAVRWLEAHGLVAAGEIPLMVALPGDVAPAPPRADLTWRRAEGEEGSRLHAALGGEVFGLPDSVSIWLGRIATCPAAEAWLVSAGDDLVATGLRLVAGEAAGGVFNVATRADRRRQGLATAVTARLVLDIVAEGRWAYLGSSDEAHPLYRSMGLRDVGTMTLWATASAVG